MNDLTLTTLALEISSLYGQTNHAMQQAVVLAAMTGQRLNEASALVPKSKGANCKEGSGFKGWLATNCPDVDYVRATQYMKLPIQFPELLNSNNKVIDNFILPLSSMLLLLGSTEEVKQTVQTRIESGEKVTSRDIRDLNYNFKNSSGKAKTHQPTNCGIYELRCILTGENYVGKSKDLAKRKSSHFSQLNAGEHGNMQQAYNSYGAEFIEFNILRLCLPENLDQYEKIYINLSKSFEEPVQ